MSVLTVGPSTMVPRENKRKETMQFSNGQVHDLTLGSSLLRDARASRDVRFSNLPVGVKHFQAIHTLQRRCRSQARRNCPPSALTRQIGWVEEGRISGSSEPSQGLKMRRCGRPVY